MEKLNNDNSAAIAATLYGFLVPLKPPFDEVTFINLVLWLVEVILVAVGVWNARKFAIRSRK